MASTPEASAPSAGTVRPSPAPSPPDARGAGTGLRALERRMTSRHLMMISFGGVIGTAMIMTGWFPSKPVWMWAALFIGLILAINLASVRVFAEAESFLSSVKVLAILAFVILGGLAVVGVIPYAGYDSAPLLHNLTADGLFPTGLGAVFTTMLTVNFAFSGTELIGITAGETKDPGATVPRAIHATLWRLVVFFIGSITVMSALIPWHEAGVEESPFVTVFNAMGIPSAGTIMNVVILTAILSATNSGLYASTRILWSLANEGTVPGVLARTNRFGVPAPAMAASMIGGLAALATSAVAASTVYIVLVSISGLAVMLVWVSIAASHLAFRHRRRTAGRSDDELSSAPSFRAPGYPWVPLAALATSAASCVLIVFDPTQRPALWMTAVFVAACYALHWVRQGRVST